MHRNKILLVITAAFWVIATTLFGNPPESKTIMAANEGFKAPDFDLRTLAGGDVSLSHLRGSVVVINFWTSWCPPCKAEMPVLQRLNGAFQGKAVSILAINVTNQDSLEAVRQFTNQNGLSLDILLDMDGTVAAAYQVQAFPSTYIVDPEGVIHKIIIGGPVSEASIRSLISEVMP